MPCSDWRIFTSISSFPKFFIKTFINDNLPPSNYRILRIEQRHNYTQKLHICLRMHLNICVSENAFRFMAGRHKHRPDLYIILYVRPMHGFYARQLYVYKFVYILSFSGTLFICCPFFFAHRRRNLNAFPALTRWRRQLCTIIHMLVNLQFSSS